MQNRFPAIGPPDRPAINPQPTGMIRFSIILEPKGGSRFHRRVVVDLFAINKMPKQRLYYPRLCNLATVDGEIFMQQSQIVHFDS